MAAKFTKGHFMGFAHHGLTVLVMFWLLLAYSTHAIAERDIPDDNLAYPVLIHLDGGGSGSGFYVNSRMRIYLVTACHVLYKSEKDSTKGTETQVLRAVTATFLSYPKDPKEEGKNILFADLKKLNETNSVKRHPVHDVAVIHIGNVSRIGDQSSISFSNGVSLKERCKSGLLGVAIENLKKFDNVLTANEVFLFGYPTSLGMKELPQLDHSRPLLRKGIVAGKNNKTKAIILDCPVYKGNSGGPVLESERKGFQNQFRVIGVITQFVPFAEVWENRTQGYANVSLSNSGYSIAAPSDAIIDLMEE